MCALVGRFTYRAMHDKVSRVGWRTLGLRCLGYAPKTVTLTRGWYCFIFRSPEDSMKVLQDTWVLNGGSLMLKIWRVGFDPVSGVFPVQTHLGALTWLVNTVLEQGRLCSHRE
jgi:hypothetical protein